MALILFVLDLHANREAMDSVLENVRCDEVLCLGDLVDYGPDPGECIDWARNNNVVTVRGNHDNAVAFRVDCGCGYVYKYLSKATREYTWASIGDNDIAFLKSLPMLVERDIEGIKITLAHGSPRSFFDCVYPDTPEGRIDELTEGISSRYLAVGHTHKPAVIKTRRLTVLNPGSVGQPRDGDLRASCMTFDTATGEARVVRVKYDLDTICRKIGKKMPHAPELEAILRRDY